MRPVIGPLTALRLALPSALLFGILACAAIDKVLGGDPGPPPIRDFNGDVNSENKYAPMFAPRRDAGEGDVLGLDVAVHDAEAPTR